MNCIKVSVALALAAVTLTGCATHTASANRHQAYKGGAVQYTFGGAQSGSDASNGVEAAAGQQDYEQILSHPGRF